MPPTTGGHSGAGLWGWGDPEGWEVCGAGVEGFELRWLLGGFFLASTEGTGDTEVLNRDIWGGGWWIDKFDV
jgi:hypothetical protein